jgi:hypothetical protein
MRHTAAISYSQFQVSDQFIVSIVIALEFCGCSGFQLKPKKENHSS